MELTPPPFPVPAPPPGLRLLAFTDVPRAMELKEIAGWNQTARDWEEYLGFRDEYELSRYEGEVPVWKSAGAMPVEPLVRGAEGEMAALDTAAFGAGRPDVLVSLAGRDPELCWLVRDAAGRPGGYLIAREGAQAVQIGPWVARSAEMAEALLGALFSRLPGRRVFVDVPCPNGAGRALMQRCGFVVQRSFTRMYLGKNLVPGWPDYRKRVFYVSYDVSALIQDGDNVLGLVLGEGWYSSTLLFDHQYGPTPMVSACLEIVDAGENPRIVKTDTTWEWSEGPIRAFHGEGWKNASESESEFVQPMTPATTFEAQLRYLKLAYTSRHHAEVTDEAARQRLSHAQFLRRIVEAEAIESPEESRAKVAVPARRFVEALWSMAPARTFQLTNSFDF